MVVKIFFYILTLLFLLIIFSNQIFSQVPEPDYPKHKIGFSFGYGDQQIKIIGLGVDLKVDYSYEILFAQFSYIYSLFNNDWWHIGFNLQTEYGITYYKLNKKFLAESRSHELGISGGIIFSSKVITDVLNLYLLFSVGPHYTQKSPERQVSGFMFNNNYDIGINIFMRDNLLFDLRTGFRHLSNANLKNPNGGINNWIISLGLIYQIENKN
ncbi:MAG: acyloxyacyl hydrolase [Ignavibacteria bacterium]|nr:acyloxyacyl hydrolase [Ignavibacteria bacterium]